MSTTENEKEALGHFRSYIESFDNKDIDGIKNELSPDIEIHMDGQKVAEGRDAILPSYEADFKIDKKVEVTRGPELFPAEASEMVARVDVGLKATVVTNKDGNNESGAGGNSVTTLDVTYVYDLQTMMQVRHEIRNVRQLGP